jgi:hypothetical protein
MRSRRSSVKISTHSRNVDASVAQFAHGIAKGRGCIGVARRRGVGGLGEGVGVVVGVGVGVGQSGDVSPLDTFEYAELPLPL